tara:strand:+ start:384 stop:1856 length:1473 start_codon:yes stop_codon:yes gene_type:complete
MAITLQIKRTTGTNSPGSLANGELAYSHGAGTQANNGKRLFVGDAANSVTVIGGQYFTDMLDHVHGTLTNSSAIITDSVGRIDDLIVGTSSTDGGSIKLREAANNGTSSTSIKSAAALGGDITFTLPNSIADGSFMMSNASGALSNTTFNTTGGAGVADFAVSGNVVSLSPTPSAFTSITSGDITITGKIISTSANNLDIVFDPHGTGEIDANNNLIKNVTDPTASHHAANKNYVDGLLQGLDVKQSVRVATTASGTMGSSFAAGQTVDGVTLVAGDRILIKDQGTGTDATNGVYVVQASGAPARATDFDTNSFPAVSSGAFFFVEEGTSNDNKGFVLTTPQSITVGTTALTFTQFSGAGTITAGAGLVGTSSFDVNVDGATLEVNSDTVRVKDSGITAAKLANSSVDLAASANTVTGTLPLANGGLGITAANIEQGSVIVSNNGTSITALDPNPGNLTGNANKNKILFYTGGNTGTMGFVDSVDGGTYT